MQQEFLMLADGAEAHGGKIFILGGGSDRYRATEFPVGLRADVAASVLVEWGEANRTFAMAIKIIDEDERTAVALEFNMEQGRPPGAKPGQSLRTLLAIKGPFRIPVAGGYKLVMELGGVAQDPPFRFWVEKAEPVGAIGG